MLGRKAILTALFVMATGAMAADKPAVQARERMEGKGQDVTFAIADGNGAGAIAQTANGNPAVAFRLAQENPAQPTNETQTVFAGGAEEHPVANVGYHARAQQPAATYFAQPAASNTATKPAVQAREQQ